MEETVEEEEWDLADLEALSSSARTRPISIRVTPRTAWEEV